MTGRKCTAETELTSKHTRRNDPGQSARVVAWIRGVRPSNPEHLEHRRLGLKNGASADRAYLYRWHRHADLEIPIVAT